MTWTLIDTPSPEELAWGYTPAPSFFDKPQTENSSSELREIRRYFVTLFCMIGLLVGLQSLVGDNPTHGQRRIAEVNLSERKGECRDCVSAVVLIQIRGDTP